jgi:hypothetical protein
MTITEQVIPIIAWFFLAVIIARCFNWKNKDEWASNIALVIVLTVILAGFFEHLKEHPLLDSDGNPQTEEPDNGWDLD